MYSIMVKEDLIRKAIVNRFGIDVDVSGSIKTEGLLVSIYPAHVNRSHSFKVSITVGWRTLEAKFVPGNFANELISAMESADRSRKSTFTAFSRILINKGAELVLAFDGVQMDPTNFDLWPKTWGMVGLSMRKTGEVFEKSTGYDYSAIVPWAVGFFGLVFSLLPLVSLNHNASAVMMFSDETGAYEGNQLISTSKRYERSPLNRALCIEVHGVKCKICGFDFANMYGELGDDFIHIHHIVPLSEMQGNYRVNPYTDLIPVCPNCHSMLHRRVPTLMPDDLRNIIKEQTKNKE